MPNIECGSSSASVCRNSQPLDNNAGYWAESFPATENPLCAAIDPTRNFRWHALNCNGPSTSAFLCELPGKDSVTYLFFFHYTSSLLDNKLTALLFFSFVLHGDLITGSHTLFVIQCRTGDPIVR